MSDRVWTVAGYEAGEKVFERTIPVDAIAESDVKGLLQRLAARGLSEEDVISASLGSDHRSGALRARRARRRRLRLHHRARRPAATTSPRSARRE